MTQTKSVCGFIFINKEKIISGKPVFSALQRYSVILLDLVSCVLNALI